MPNTPTRPNKRRKTIFRDEAASITTIVTTMSTAIDRFQPPPGMLFDIFQEHKDNHRTVPCFVSKIALIDQQAYLLEDVKYTYQKTDYFGGVLYPSDGISTCYYVCKKQSYQSIFHPDSTPRTFLMVPIPTERAQQMIVLLAHNTPPPSDEGASSDDQSSDACPFDPCAGAALFETDHSSEEAFQSPPCTP